MHTNKVIKTWFGVVLVCGAQTFGGTLKIEEAKPFPNFSRTELLGSLSRDLLYHKLADLNKDGRPDILVITSVPSDDFFNQGGVRIYLQQSDGSFALHEDHIVSEARGPLGA
jgi:hypothetical protein